ncbi:DUF3000 family protein [Nocardioides albertanoniae]|uniref:DUF3000 family protein n=1 Tax=Nocardioides albertanoniae TaxID=1175486 RepID=A0A543A3Y5_9ACTN|nr:DUF3000 domain-containing protein [Nocardioides albertanoniae]TQL67176.1 DUF3000 family protein [Nocardioides albertanoniae]
MVVRGESRPTAGAESGPAAFRSAAEGLRAASFRPEVLSEEMPAPQRIAPFAAALSADVTIDDVDVATGRLILLHDPDGNDAWGSVNGLPGTFRLVAYVRADIDVEHISDPLLGEVGWSWLVDALAGHGAEHVAAAGTVTRVATEAYGGMSEEDGTAQIEIRASWTPVGDAAGATDVKPHTEAWGELLCTAAGLPPVPEGVTVMPSRRGQRGA